jgi:molybdopterin-synthase adenylyltransferase
MARALTEEERQTYEWQLDVPGFGEAGQLALRNTTALVSRVGGLGGPVAFQLAAAGFGRIILAHGGKLKPSDLNRQITMTHDGLGKSRAEQAAATLRRFNPMVEIVPVASNITADNAAELVGQADIVFDCAPLFEERFLMNEQCVKQRKPLIDAAMYNMEGQVIPIVPGKTPCLACLYPELPPHWKRQFPVIGAVSAMIGNIAVLEAIKLLTGMSSAQQNRMIYVDTHGMSMRSLAIKRRPDCAVCGSI